MSQQPPSQPSSFEERLARLEALVREMGEQQIRQQASVLGLKADVQSYLALQRQMLTGQPHPLKTADDVNAAYLRERKSRLQMLLLLKEAREPGLAAKLEAILSDDSLHWPLEWD